MIAHLRKKKEPLFYATHRHKILVISQHHNQKWNIQIWKLVVAEKAKTTCRMLLSGPKSHSVSLLWLVFDMHYPVVQVELKYSIVPLRKVREQTNIVNKSRFRNVKS